MNDLVKPPITQTWISPDISVAVIEWTKSATFDNLDSTPFWEIQIVQRKPRQKYRETYKYFLELLDTNWEKVTFDCIEGVYNLLTSLHSSYWKLYVSKSRTERRYLEILAEELWDTFLSRLGHSWYYIWNISETSKEKILLEHKVENWMDLDEDEEFEWIIGNTSYRSKCKWIDKWKTTYYVESVDSSWVKKVIHIAKQWYVLLLKLFQNKGELLKCGSKFRSERDQIRGSFWSDFLNTIPWVWIYIGELADSNDFLSTSLLVGKIDEKDQKTLALPNMEITFTEKRSYNRRFSYVARVQKYPLSSNLDTECVFTHDEVNLLFKFATAEDGVIESLDKNQKRRVSGIRQQLWVWIISWEKSIGWYLDDPKIDRSTFRKSSSSKVKSNIKEKKLGKREIHIQINQILQCNPWEIFTIEDIVEILEHPASHNTLQEVVKNIIVSNPNVSWSMSEGITYN